MNENDKVFYENTENGVCLKNHTVIKNTLDRNI